MIDSRIHIKNSGTDLKYSSSLKYSSISIMWHFIADFNDCNQSSAVNDRTAATDTVMKVNEALSLTFITVSGLHSDYRRTSMKTSSAGRSDRLIWLDESRSERWYRE